MRLRVKPAMTAKVGMTIFFYKDSAWLSSSQAFVFRLMGLRVKPAMTTLFGHLAWLQSHLSTFSRNDGKGWHGITSWGSDDGFVLRFHLSILSQ